MTSTLLLQRESVSCECSRRIYSATRMRDCVHDRPIVGIRKVVLMLGESKVRIVYWTGNTAGAPGLSMLLLPSNVFVFIKSAPVATSNPLHPGAIHCGAPSPLGGNGEVSTAGAAPARK